MTKDVIELKEQMGRKRNEIKILNEELKTLENEYQSELLSLAERVKKWKVSVVFKGKERATVDGYILTRGVTQTRVIDTAKFVQLWPGIAAKIGSIPVGKAEQELEKLGEELPPEVVTLKESLPHYEVVAKVVEKEVEDDDASRTERTTERHARKEHGKNSKLKKSGTGDRGDTSRRKSEDTLLVPARISNSTTRGRR